MKNKYLIKYESRSISRVGNAISATEKLLIKIEPHLIPYRKKDKWGFCTPQKKIVIDCVYDSVEKFYNANARVKLKKKWYLINKYGVIDYKYSDDVPEALDNLKRDVVMYTNLGFQDYKSIANSLLTQPNYNVVNKNIFYSYIKRIFENIPEEEIQERKTINEGMKICRDKSSGKFGFENELKEFDIQCIYEEVGMFLQGLARVQLNGKNGFINKKGQIIIPLKYHFCMPFINGISLVYLEGASYGYIDKSGVEYWED